jgi:hypothetical protein
MFSVAPADKDVSQRFVPTFVQVVNATKPVTTGIAPVPYAIYVTPDTGVGNVSCQALPRSNQTVSPKTGGVAASFDKVAHGKPLDVPG